MQEKDVLVPKQTIVNAVTAYSSHKSNLLHHIT